MTERERRLFFALWPSDGQRNAVEIATRPAIAQSESRAIPARNFHITLAFLGSVAESRIDALLQFRDEAKVEPFSLRMSTLSFWQRQRLLCLEPSEGKEPLTQLASRIQKWLVDTGFLIEKRAFRGHLTVARDVERWGRDEEEVGVPTWPVTEIELVESTSTPAGSVYTVLKTGAQPARK